MERISAREFSPNFFGVIKLLENIFKILESPSASFALLGVLILIFFGLYLRKIKLTTRTLINISLMLALSILLHQFKLYHFPQGGSVTLGGMIPLLLISFRYGAGVGTLAGFIFGLITIIQDPFILHPIQVLFDYPLPYMAVGIAGIFKDKIFLGTILAFVGKFICHFISGVVFFASYAPEGTSAILYSLTVNASLIVPEMLICLAILKFLPVQRLLAAMERNN
ncbi:MAG: energy-coupled thiamine transporter ThiT [Selenomonadaceae bacterium]|nr:energy-coupled thiamine transporter ThiT [Selenomonadaceae bacterium]